MIAHSEGKGLKDFRPFFNSSLQKYNNHFKITSVFNNYIVTFTY